MIKVHLWWKGATPAEIDRNIADPLERQMASVDNVDYLESSITEGTYTLLLNFDYDADVDVAYQDALAAMSRANRSLPVDMDAPLIMKADPSQLPVIQLVINSEQWDLVQIRDWAKNWLQDRLLSVRGVAGAEIIGGLEREIRILLDQGALEKYGLTLTEVQNSLKAENVEQFAGRVTVGRTEIIARTTAEVKKPEELQDIIVKQETGQRVFLKDIATIEDGSEEARVITRFNGEPCVKLSILKQSAANTVEVASGIAEQLKILHDALPPEVEIELVENQATYIESAINGVFSSAWQAVILLIIVVFLFLGSMSHVLLMIFLLFFVLICNFGLMQLSGFSLNIFSLGGLVISLGVLLDNSIVVVENISRHLQSKPTRSISETIVEGCQEVGMAIVAASASFLSLFTSFLLVPGLSTLLFRELILVIAGIVIISLVAAISITPFLCQLFFADGRETGRKQSTFEHYFARLTEKYGNLLSAVVIKHKKKTCAFFILGTIFSFWGAGGVGTEFLPSVDDGRIMIKLRTATGTAIAETERLLLEIERAIDPDSHPEIESVFSMAGGRIFGIVTYEIANEGELNIQLVPREKRKINTLDFITKIRNIVSKVPIPGGMAMVSQMKLRGIRSLGNSDIDIAVNGVQLETIFAKAAEIATIARTLPELTNVRLASDMSKPEFSITPDRQKAMEYGLRSGQISESLRTLIGGGIATRYREEGFYYNIRTLIPEKDLNSIYSVEEIPLISANGNILRIKDVAIVEQKTGPVEIVRENQTKQVIVNTDTASGVSLGEAINSLNKALENIELPAGYTITLGGKAREMAKMTDVLFKVLLFSIFFAFVILVVQFNNFKLPALIMSCIPIGLSGVLLTLNLSGLALGATVIIGLLVVVATNINDGVLLLVFANELKETEKLSAEVAVVRAACLRLKPRVMTTLTTLAGLFPLTLGIADGGDMLQPMAVGASGGLIFTLFVSLFMMPALYAIVYKNRMS
jgi:multidrug efflux pump subunit AcrB